MEGKNKPGFPLQTWRLESPGSAPHALPDRAKGQSSLCPQEGRGQVDAAMQNLGACLDSLH